MLPRITTFRLRAHAQAVALAISLIVVAVLAVRVAALDGDTPSGTPLTSAFTYQGRVTDGGLPVEGTCDFRFGLFDAPAAGGAIGSALEKPALTVEDGLFSTTLDFGGPAFDGERRFLAVEARCPAGSGEYAAIGPRQELTAAPYALFAAGAPWSGITGIPAGVGEGVAWENVIVVAKSGGHFTSIQAAVDSIAGAAETNRFLVWVAPGVYDERVVLKEWVNLEGAGPELVLIRAPGGASSQAGATISLPAGANLRRVTVVNTGGGTSASGVLAGGASGTPVRVEDVVITVSQATSTIGIGTAGNPDVEVRRARITVEGASGGGTHTVAVEAVGGLTPATLTVEDSTITATGGFIDGGILVRDSYGTRIERTRVAVTGSIGGIGISIGGNALPVPVEVVVREAEVDVRGGSTATGVQILDQASASRTIVTDSSIEVQQSTSAVGVKIFASSPSVRLTRIAAFGASSATGIEHGGMASPLIDGVVVVATGGPSRAIAGDASAGTVTVSYAQLFGATSINGQAAGAFYRIASTQLAGPVAPGGQYTCAQSLDGSLNELSATCQPVP